MYSILDYRRINKGILILLASRADKAIKRPLSGLGRYNIYKNNL